MKAAARFMIGVAVFMLYAVADAGISALVRSDASGHSWEAVSAYIALAAAGLCAFGMIGAMAWATLAPARKQVRKHVPDYAFIGRMEREVYGEAFHHDGAPEVRPPGASGVTRIVGTGTLVVRHECARAGYESGYDPVCQTCAQQRERSHASCGCTDVLRTWCVEFTCGCGKRVRCHASSVLDRERRCNDCGWLRDGATLSA